MSRQAHPPGVTAIILFFLFGAVISGLTALMVTFPGSFLDAVWRLNPRARDAFTAMGFRAVLLMIVVCSACLTSAVGLWRHARWGYATALIVLGANMIGDGTNALIERDWHTLIGLPVAGAMIVYLVTKRKLFGQVREDKSQ